MAIRAELTGIRFGRLVVTKVAGKSKDGKRLWECVCDCGKMSVVLEASLRKGLTRSCSCLKRELLSKRNSVHELAGTPEYRAWAAMKTRCLNPNSQHYSHYGGRGITICDRWVNSFEDFLQDMGKKPSPKHTVDRLDVNGNYEPSNCRWATREVQARNRRNTRLIHLNGRVHCLAEWLKVFGLSRCAFYGRIAKGWTVEQALTTPSRKKHKRRQHD